MDRRGFFKKVAGLVVGAASAPLAKAKAATEPLTLFGRPVVFTHRVPSASSPGVDCGEVATEIVFKATDLPAIVVGDLEVLSISETDIETCFRRWHYPAGGSSNARWQG